MPRLLPSLLPPSQRLLSGITPFPFPLISQSSPHVFSFPYLSASPAPPPPPPHPGIGPLRPPAPSPSPLLGPVSFPLLAAAPVLFSLQRLLLHLRSAKQDRTETLRSVLFDRTEGQDRTKGLCSARPNRMASVRSNRTEERPSVRPCLIERCRREGVPGTGESWCARTERGKGTVMWREGDGGGAREGGGEEMRAEGAERKERR